MAPPRARTITTAWNATFRRPAIVTEPNRTTTYSYDSNGNVLTKTVTDTTVTPNVARTWIYTYNTYGRVLTADGPRTDVSDVTTYTYYTCTTGYQCGQLQTVTNAASQTTTYNTYNAYGQPLSITDPNGILTTLTYDARQRLTSRVTASETTAFDYWPTGLLKKVTLRMPALSPIPTMVRTV
jgi:YD repeat-containing protein